MILTPQPPDTPRINGARVFGVRPGSPFLFTIPATGRRPMKFAAEGLPAGLALDPASGRITGAIAQPGEWVATLEAANALGRDRKRLRIVAGPRIALTPPMGWNSWNCWAEAVDQEKVLRSARTLVSSGLIRHGWTYVNIDDTWQGLRTGPDHALEANGKFPEMKALCAEIHALGLKAGIYSTPWVTSYAGHCGGSAESPEGIWTKPPADRTFADKPALPWDVGPFHFAKQDVRQWASWGFDYLKYDWKPNDVPNVREMADALRGCGRDIVYSLSNKAPFEGAADWARLSNCWRTTQDIVDTWESVSEIAALQPAWGPYAGPGHWNDPDMLVLGWVGWGPKLHSTRLTPDEQYLHISLWCLLSAPLLLGCDLDRLDAFTLGLITNDEVLALDQDPLGRQASLVSTHGAIRVLAKPLEDGSIGAGLFNFGDQPAEGIADWAELGLAGRRAVRDLWRQKDLGVFDGTFTAAVAPHGVVLIRLSTPAPPAP